MIELAKEKSTPSASFERGQAVMDALQPQLVGALPDLPPSVVASCVWACARLDVQLDDQVLPAVEAWLLEPVAMTPTARSDGHGATTAAGRKAARRAKALAAAAAAAAAAATGAVPVSPKDAPPQPPPPAPPRTTTRLQRCSPADFGSFMYAFNYYARGSPTFWEAAAAAAQPKLRLLKPAATVNLLSSLAAARTAVAPTPAPAAPPRPAPLLAALAHELVEDPALLMRYRPRDLAALAGAYASMGQRAVPLFDQMAQLLLADRGRRLAGCRAVDLCLLAWAFVHAFHAHPALLHASAACMRRLLVAAGDAMPHKAPHLAPTDTARVLWAWAVAGVRQPAALAAVADAAALKMHAASPQAAAAGLWALAKLNYAAPGFMEAALDRLACCMDSAGVAGGGGGGAPPPPLGQPSQPHSSPSLDPQLGWPPFTPAAAAPADGSISDGKDACPAGIVPRHPNDDRSTLQLLLSAAPPDVTGHARAGGREVAQALWAMGRLGHRNGAFLRSAARHLPHALPSLTDAALVQVAWGLAKLQAYDHALLDAVCEEALNRLPRLDASSVGLLVWSLASLRHYHARLMEGAARRAARLGDRMRAWDAARVAAGFAELQHPDGALFRAVCRATLRLLPGITHRLLINTLWACAVAGHFDEALMAAALARLNAAPLSALHPLGLMQLFQAQALWQDAYGGAVTPVAQLRPRLQSACERQWLASLRTTTVSGFQSDVAAALGSMGLHPRLEQRSEDGLFSIDVTLTWRGRHVAVETDGPSHFTRTRPHRPLGSTAAKRRCLALRGYVVVPIPFYEWRQLRRDHDNGADADAQPAGAADGSGGGCGGAPACVPASADDGGSGSDEEDGGASGEGRRAGAQMPPEAPLPAATGDALLRRQVSYLAEKLSAAGGQPWADDGVT